MTDRNPRYSAALTTTGTLRLVRVDRDWRIDENKSDYGSGTFVPST